MPLIYRKGAPPAKAYRLKMGQAGNGKNMKQKSLTTVAVAASTFASAAPLSFGWSEQGGVSLSVESAQARVGRPLSPVSVAGVARRQNRRAIYGAAVVGAGAVAAGTTRMAPGLAITDDDYAAREHIGCKPGSVVKGDNGLMYRCQ
jgi:hypothetical protein